mgnify:FL=1
MFKILDIFNFVDSSKYNIKNLDIKFENFCSISIASSGDVTFCSDTSMKGLKLINNSNSSLIICHSKFFKKTDDSTANLIFVDSPRLTFIKCMKKFLPESCFSGIHESSIVETKQIGKNVSIGPFCYISKNVIIGNNVQIFGNVNIYDNTKIGNNVIIYASSVIGSDGFSFESTMDNSLIKFPHIGGVDIQDDVEIGCNTCIDKGTLENTIIGKGTKINNLVHIAHNVIVGKNCLILENSVIAGSCLIEDNVFISISSSLRDKIKIGKNSIIGMGTVVLNDVPQNSKVYGVPGSIHK